MPGILSPGRHYQLYTSVIPGAAALAEGLAQIAAMDPQAGVVFHGFPSSLPARYPAYVLAARNAGLRPGAAFGLDTTTVTAEAKGDAVGEVASRADAYVVLIDCESHYDSAPDRAQEMTTLGQHARAAAPNALLIAQPWPEPLDHAGFPYEEQNAFCDANAPQYYYNSGNKPLGPGRYAHLTPIFDAQWHTLNTGRLANTPRLMLKTIQADGWDDVIWDLITCLLANPTVIVWCDNGLPQSRAWRTAIDAVGRLAARGFAGDRAVWSFQTSQQAAGTYTGTIDGQAGPVTLGMLGIDWSDPGV